MFGKCYHYALATFFDLYACLSSGTVMATPDGGFIDLGDQALQQPYIDVPQLGRAPVLVHGFVVGRSREIKDIKFGHAWIEGNGFVLDCGSAEKVHALVPLDRYYEFWSIKPEECHRYTLQQATHHIIITGTLSHWHAAPADAISVEFRQRFAPRVRQADVSDQANAVADGATDFMRSTS
jgi:hypothetical protein